MYPVQSRLEGWVHLPNTHQGKVHVPNTHQGYVHVSSTIKVERLGTFIQYIHEG